MKMGHLEDLAFSFLCYMTTKQFTITSIVIFFYLVTCSKLAPFCKCKDTKMSGATTYWPTFCVSKADNRTHLFFSLLHLLV